MRIPKHQIPLVLLSLLGMVSSATGSLLAPWVSPNTILGRDPFDLPPNDGQNQAEPHAIRAMIDPDLILATFQEGRFSDGGARNNGYAVSEDGGFTWKRRLNPNLTIINGGPYFRATDPVGGINRQGDLFLNSLVAVDFNFDKGRLVVQRSVDRGTTWTGPVTVYSGYYNSDTNYIFPDKNWMVINDYLDEPTTGRLVVTWTDFRVIQDGSRDIIDYLIRSSYSDDNGASWSAATYVTPPTSSTSSFLQYQGSQPVFLPGGGLAIVFHNFRESRLEVRYSPDGGATYPFSSKPVHNGYILYDMPNIRDGTFLPSVGVARETGNLYIAYTSKDTQVDPLGHIYFVRSDRVSAQPPASGDVDWNFRQPVRALASSPRQVSMPTLAVSPDGQRVTIYFYDNRNGSGANDSGDFYAVQSIDGGVTWSQAFRLTEQTFDLANATGTSRGYMIGDYFGFAPPLGPDQAGVAVWVDTREGEADPWSSRIGNLEGDVFAAWLQANLPHARRSASPVDDLYADPDKDQTPNLLEYVLGRPPFVADPVPGFGDNFSHLLLNASTDPATQVVARGGQGRWPAQQVISGSIPQEAFYGERYWKEMTWPSAGTFEHLEFSINGAEDWFLLDESAPVRWVREEAGNWVWSPWFGYLYTDAAPWLFHSTLGWVYDFQGVLYCPAVSSYLYPSPSIHPWMYRHNGYHVYLLEGTPWIYDTFTGNWIETY